MAVELIESPNQLSPGGVCLRGGFAIAVHEEKETCQKQQCNGSNPHLDFERYLRRDVRGREESQCNSETRYRKPADSGEAEDIRAVVTGFARVAGRQSDECGEHVEKRYQLEYNRQIQERLEGFLDLRADKTHRQKHDRYAGLHK